MKALFTILLLSFFSVCWAQSSILGLAFGAKKSEIERTLKSKGIDFIKANDMWIIDEWTIKADLIVSVDLKFLDGKLDGLELQSEELIDHSAKKKIPKLFRRLNRIFQDDLGLPKNLKQFDFHSIHEAEFTAYRQWSGEKITSQLGILKMEDAFAVRLIVMSN